MAYSGKNATTTKRCNARPLAANRESEACGFGGLSRGIMHSIVSAARFFARRQSRYAKKPVMPTTPLHRYVRRPVAATSGCRYASVGIDGLYTRNVRAPVSPFFRALSISCSPPNFPRRRTFRDVDFSARTKLWRRQAVAGTLRRGLPLVHSECTRVYRFEGVKTRAFLSQNESFPDRNIAFVIL